MKKQLTILTLVVIAFSTLFSCEGKLDSIATENPFEGETRKLNIKLVYPEGWEHEMKAGAEIIVTNPRMGADYKLESNADGTASIDLQYGFYRLSVTDKGSPVLGKIPLFNRSVDQIRMADTLSGDITVEVDLSLSFSSQLVIKESYYGGCWGSDNKAYRDDKYVIIYNNSDQVAYLDSLCFAQANAYNTLTRLTPWSYVNEAGQDVIMDSIPAIDAVWQFTGNGTTYPLQPGEQTVLIINNAKDHTIEHPNSVDLSKSEYFVLYNAAKFHRTPAPHPNLAGKWLDLIWYDTPATMYTYSVSSPAVIIFKVPGMTAEEYASNPDNRMRQPGSTQTKEYVMVPSEWVIDGVDTYRSPTNFKRLPATVDAGYAMIADGTRDSGRTIHRKIDEEATAAAGGRIVYQDTNNSTNDFYVRESQSLKE